MNHEKSCGAIVYRNSERGMEYLLVRQLAGHWSFPKGHLEKNESEYACARREVFEETGLEITILDGFRETVCYRIGSDTEKEVVFFLAEAAGGMLRRQDAEIKEVKWCAYREALMLITHDNIRRLFVLAEQFLEKTVRNAILNDVPTWDRLLKEALFDEFMDTDGLRILDFGAGKGLLADYLARKNKVVAIEPDEEAVHQRSCHHSYDMICGDETKLAELEGGFDLILCHNVLEYVCDQQKVVRMLSRLLKEDGKLSVVKHNRPGRVMQMAVLLNDFKQADALLDGADGKAAKYGTIHYYRDEDLIDFDHSLQIIKVKGFRAFYDLQQNQSCHQEAAWQKKMLELEKRVMEKEPYRSVAFFHILLLQRGMTD